MPSDCFKYRKNTESRKDKNERIMLLSKCTVFYSKTIKIYQRARS